MAITCLALSFLTFFVPLGIASVVMGHISRSQIAKSGGRLKGTGLAFAGLIIAYLQFAVVLLVMMGIHATAHKLNESLNHDEFARAAMVEELQQRSRKKPSDVEKQRQYAINALRLIHAAQMDYLAAHPNEGYACQLYNLGWDTTPPNELTIYDIGSHYETKIYQCRGLDDQRYAVVAIPRSEWNPPDSPVYCLDQTGVIRRSNGDWINDIPRIFITERKGCPESDEVVWQP